MIKEEQQKELKRLFDLYDECNQNIEEAVEIWYDTEDTESDAIINVQQEHEKWCSRKNEVVEDIKTLCCNDVNQKDLLEVIRENFVDTNLVGEFKIDKNIPIPSERKLN